MAHSYDGHIGTYRAVLTDGDICDRGVQDEAVTVDECGRRNSQSEAVVDVDGALDIGDYGTARTGDWYEWPGIATLCCRFRLL